MSKNGQYYFFFKKKMDSVNHQSTLETNVEELQHFNLPQTNIASFSLNNLELNINSGKNKNILFKKYQIKMLLLKQLVLMKITQINLKFLMEIMQIKYFYHINYWWKNTCREWQNNSIKKSHIIKMFKERNINKINCEDSKGFPSNPDEDGSPFCNIRGNKNNITQS